MTFHKIRVLLFFFIRVLHVLFFLPSARKAIEDPLACADYDKYPLNGSRYLRVKVVGNVHH